MTLFVLSTIPLINMTKADKRMKIHIINQHNEIEYIYEIFNKHYRAFEAAIDMGKEKNSDLMIDMFRQNQSMTNSPRRLKTR